MSSTHMDFQTVGPCVLSVTAVNWTKVLVFGFTGRCATPRLDMASEISNRMHTSQDGSTAIRARNAVLGVA